MTRLLALLLLAACAPAAMPTAAPDPWTLRTLDGRPLGARATLAFTPGGVEGAAPCNGYSAVAADGPGPSFALGPVTATEMACPALPQEARFLAALAQVTERREEGGTLTLSGPAHSLVFTR